MSVTLTLGWWIIPAVMTVAWVAYGFMPARPSDYGADIAGVARLLASLIVVLISWIVYLVLVGV